MSEDRCPPHKFQGGFTSLEDEARGVIWCQRCGDIRELKVPAVEAPVEERVRNEKQGK